MINKYYVSEQYLYDLEAELLHNLKGIKSPDNKPCHLEKISKLILFDDKHLPVTGKEIKVKTAGGKKKFSIRNHCPFCIGNS